MQARKAGGLAATIVVAALLQYLPSGALSPAVTRASPQAIGTLPPDGLPRPLPDASEVKQPLEPASAAPIESIPSTLPIPDTAINRTQGLLTPAALATATPAAAQTTTPGAAPSSPQAAPASQTAPVPLTPGPAEWPAEARRDSIEGWVILNVHVGADGRVIETQPLETVLNHAGSGAAIASGSRYGAAFVTAASEAAMRWTFRPAMRGDEPVAAWMPLTMPFMMDNGTIEAARAACAVPADVRQGVPSRQVVSRVFNHWTPVPGARPITTPATPTDRPWLECLTARLNENAGSEEVRTYRAYAVATLAQLGVQ